MVKRQDDRKSRDSVKYLSQHTKLQANKDFTSMNILTPFRNKLEGLREGVNNLHMKITHKFMMEVSTTQRISHKDT
jgi:hypothetical protein